jgi:serine/threonine protein kinase
MGDWRTPGRGTRPSGPFARGTLLGKYEILKRLATGGMAEIYLARVSGLPGIQKMVVVKRILPQFADKPDFIEMFLDEARIVATLEHPNVVQLYDVGVVDRNYFIAMEYLHGEDVRSVARTLARAGRKMPLEHAVNILIGVAAGLHYAHEKVGFDGKPLRIVHRDVNPQNVIVTYDGTVKLLDFGIAKASNRLNETRMGTLKGKVPYMSPEQCRGEALDRRSDLFSLGIMLYELTLGKQLYPGKSDFEVLKQIVEGTVVPPRQIDPTYPSALEEIVMHALEKDKERRYQTAREMQVDLEALVWQERLHTSPIVLAHFMEELFKDKIDAWRAAQSRGETLGEHLQTIASGPKDQEDDDAPVIEIAAADAKRVAAERAAFRAHIEATSGEHSLLPRRGLGMAVAVLALMAAGGAAAWYARSTLFPSGKPATTAATAGPAEPKPRSAARPETELATPTVPSEMAERSRPAAAAPEPPTQPEPSPEPSTTPEPSPGPHPGSSKVSTAPAGATASLDGKKTRPGTLKPKHGSGKPEPLSSAQPLPPRMPLSPPSAPVVQPTTAEPPARLDGEGTLMLASTPWCNVSVDGVVKGTTPLSVKLPAGKHTVLLTNPEFKIKRTLPVTISPDETVRKRLEFTP